MSVFKLQKFFCNIKATSYPIRMCECFLFGLKPFYADCFGGSVEEWLFISISCDEPLPLYVINKPCVALGGSIVSVYFSTLSDFSEFR